MLFKSSDRLYSFFNWISIIAYLPVVLFGFFFPNFFSSLIFIDSFEGNRLNNFSSLMVVVSVLGVIYLLAKIANKKSLFDISIFWRIILIAPILIINLVHGSMEPILLSILIFTDFIIPLIALFSSDKKQLIRLKKHFLKIPKRIINKYLMIYSLIGFMLVFLIVVSYFYDNNLGYGNTIIVSVFGCHFVALFWASYLEEKYISVYVIGIKLALISVFYLTPILQINKTNFILNYFILGIIIYVLLIPLSGYFPTNPEK